MNIVFEFYLYACIVDHIYKLKSLSKTTSLYKNDELMNKKSRTRQFHLLREISKGLSQIGNIHVYVAPVCSQDKSVQSLALLHITMDKHFIVKHSAHPDDLQVTELAATET